jgi:hypothetical protein
LQLENKAQNTSVLLRRCISEALDKDAFGVVSSRVPAEFLFKCVIVDPAQMLGVAEINSAERVLSSLAIQNVALLDRTGDVQVAAEEVVTSRMAFGGRSRYAADLVLVNEFKADELIKALVQVTEKYQAANTDADALIQSKTLKSSSIQSDIALIEQEVKRKKAKFIQSNSEAGIVEVLDRYDFHLDLEKQLFESDHS